MMVKLLHDFGQITSTYLRITFQFCKLRLNKLPSKFPSSTKMFLSKIYTGVPIPYMYIHIHIYLKHIYRKVHLNVGK